MRAAAAAAVVAAAVAASSWFARGATAPFWRLMWILGVARGNREDGRAGRNLGGCSLVLIALRSEDSTLPSCKTERLRRHRHVCFAVCSCKVGGGIASSRQLIGHINECYTIRLP